jgi:hypothetical protein
LTYGAGRGRSHRAPNGCWVLERLFVCLCRGVLDWSDDVMVEVMSRVVMRRSVTLWFDTDERACVSGQDCSWFRDIISNCHQRYKYFCWFLRYLRLQDLSLDEATMMCRKGREDRAMPACQNRWLLSIFSPFAYFKILDSMILVHFEKDHVEKSIATNQQLPWRSLCYRKLE